MSKFFIRLNDIVGLPAASNSSTATLTIPSASDPAAGIMDVVRIFVTRGASAATLAQMRSGLRELEVRFGTEAVQRLKVSELLMLLEANNYTPEDGELPLYFAHPWRATVTEESVTAPDLRRVSKAQINLDVVNDATPFAFQFVEEYRTEAKTLPDGRPITGMIGYDVQTDDIAGGDESVIKLNPVKGPLNRMFLQVPSTATITRVRIRQGSNTIYDITQTAAIKGLKSQLKQMGMKIPANYTDHQGTWAVWPIVFDNTQRLTDTLTNTAGLEIVVTIDTGATFRLLREVQIDRG